MLLSRIQRDLFEFTGKDPEDFAGLVEFWYQENSDALSAALAAQEGLNIIVNIANFRSFEPLAKRLFLLADTLIIRDTREWKAGSGEYQDIPIPFEYKPGFWDDVADELKQLKPSPMTLLQKPTLYWTSTHKRLNNGYEAAYAGGAWSLIPAEFKSWIAGGGRRYLETGNVVYAPFIPPLALELEFLKEGVVIPDYFGGIPFFHQRFEWLDGPQLHALLSLNMPFLDGLDISTISAVKSDHREEFAAFSRSMLDSIVGVKAALGTDGFVSEVKHIQRNLIDAALSDVLKAVSRIKRSEALRKAGLLTGLIGLNGAALLGIPAVALVGGIGTAGAALIAEKIAQLKADGELRDEKGYFLWTMQEAAGAA